MDLQAHYMEIDNITMAALHRCDSDEIADMLDRFEDAKKFELVDIDKMWEGLHYFLTGTLAADADEADPLSEAVLGTDVFDDDEDSDFVAYITPNRLKELLPFLEKIDLSVKSRMFSPFVYRQRKIYPDIWVDEDRELLLQALLDSFEMLLTLYRKCVSKNYGVIISIF